MRADALLDRVPAGTPAILVTVAQVEGSAPRDPGASMVVTPDDVVGSIGGGRLEHDVVARARAALVRGATEPAVERHVLGPGLGQCCGGAVTLWISPVATTGARPPWCGTLAVARREGHPVTLATVISSERADVRVGTCVVFDADRVHHAEDDPAVVEALVAAARDLLAANGGRAGCLRHGSLGASVVVLVEPDADEPVTVVFGAGHVGRALVGILALLPGRVRWVDARPEAFPDQVPHGVDCREVSSPEDEVDEAPAGASFVVLTHDHALDLRLAEAILDRGDFAYFGLIGSATKRERFVRRLRTRGIASDRIRRMRCPIGLRGVGGKAPGEIAVAIAAEILAHRVGILATATQAAGGTVS